MPRFSFSSLRFRLVLLVLLAIIPAFGLILYTASEDRQRETAKVREDTLRLARLISLEQEHLIEQGRHLLISLSELPEVGNRNSNASSKILADILKQHPRYANIGATDPDGNIFCSAIPLSRPINMGDLPGIKRAIQTREFTVGAYQIGTIVGRPVLPLPYPALDESGRVQFVMFATIDLAWLNQFASEAKLPTGSALTMIDRNGIVLIRHPDPEKWVGKSMPEATLVKTILNQQTEGIIEAAGVDGVPSLYAFTPLPTPRKTDAYLVVGVPNKIAFAAVYHIVTRNLIWLGLVAVLTLAAAWVGGDLLILRKAKALVGAAKRLTVGDLSARTGLAYGPGEIGQLARAFDEMAEALEQNEVDRKQAEEVLLLAKERLQFLLSNTPAVIYTCVPSGDYGATFVSENVHQLLGYEPGEFTKNSIFWADHIHPEDAPGIFADLSHLFEKGYHVHEYRFQHKDGTYRWVHDEMNLVRDANGNPLEIAGYWIDITKRKRMEETLRESREQLRALAARFSEVEEGERRRLARELHDRVGQNLTALGITLNIMQTQLSAQSAARVRDRFEDSLRLVAETAEDIRDVMADLHPPILDDYGLLDALHWYCDKFSNRTGVATIVGGEELISRLPPEIEIALFRIAQEALTNVAKHARASQVNVTLEKVARIVLLTIADNGVGFDPMPLRQPGEQPRWGLGLITIRERAEQFGGHLHIESEPGQGTRIVVEVRS